MGDVDLVSGEGGGEGVEMEVPAGGGGVLGWSGERVGEVEDGVVVGGLQLPGEGGPGAFAGGARGAPGGRDLQEPGRVELGDGAIEGGVALGILVTPAEGEVAALGELQVGIAPPSVELGGSVRASQTRSIA
jgi:hypothetical protein